VTTVAQIKEMQGALSTLERATELRRQLHADHVSTFLHLTPPSPAGAGMPAGTHVTFDMRSQCAPTLSEKVRAQIHSLLIEWADAEVNAAWQHAKLLGVELEEPAHV
jgi:hypothetical protein